jgi:hypothetical protein
MASFTSLPDELTVQIISYLEDDTAALASLCAVSRVAREIAENILYSKVAVVEGGFDNDIYDTNARLILLLRTLLVRYDLSLKLKSLSLTVRNCSSPYIFPNFGENALKGDGWQSFIKDCGRIFDYLDEVLSRDSYLERDSGASDNNRQDLFLEFDKLSGCHHHALKAWWLAVSKGLMTAVSGLLLAVTPNVTDLKLALTDSPHEFSPRLDPMQCLFDSREGSNFSPLIPSLQLRNSVTRLSTLGGNIEILSLEFPRLSELEVDLMVHHSDDYNVGNLLAHHADIPAYKHLKSLVLRSDWSELRVGHYPLRDVENLLAMLRCSQLQRLSFIVERTPTDEYYPPVLFETALPAFQVLASFDFLIQNLNLTARCLVELSIDCNKNPVFFNRDICFPHFDPILSLQNFVRLEKFTVLQQALIPSDYNQKRDGRHDLRGMLPTPLRCLSIIAWDGRILLWLKNLHRVLDGYPVLREINIVCRPNWRRSFNWFNHASRPIATMFGAVGVQINVVEDDAEYTEDFGFLGTQLSTASSWDGSWTDDEWWMEAAFAGCDTVG